MRATDLNTAVFAFGRLNPPTIGHGRLVDMVKNQPGKPFLFLTHTQKPDTDPLTFQQKIKYARASFDDITIGDPEVRTLIQALQKLESMGFAHVILVAGSDRVKQFDSFLPKYNGKDYNFESVKVVSSGERDPDADGIKGMSASKLKRLAAEGKFEDWKDERGETQPGFKSGVVNPDIAKDMYNDVRAGMNIKEAVTENITDKPKVYVDMDGVIADFFSALAQFRKVNHWKDEGEVSVEDSIKAIAGTEFFYTLPVFPTAKQLIQIVKGFTGGEWNICSSPLRGDHENSKKHKVRWLRDNGFSPTDIIITGRKESYAVNKTNNIPNILIDDKPSNIERWIAKGGIGIRYQANKDNLSRISTALKLVETHFEKNDSITPELVTKINQSVDSGQLVEWGGRVVKGVNTTIDVGVDAITKQSAKLGFKVDRDGRPPKLRERKSIFSALTEKELKFQNEKGDKSLLTLPGTKEYQKMKKTSEPGTEKWFKAYRTLPYMTKGRKNHYMLPVKEQIALLENQLKQLKEKWSAKYKKSIDCTNPKGFSQKAHCDGRKKK
jgi:hypothetical protein